MDKLLEQVDLDLPVEIDLETRLILLLRIIFDQYAHGGGPELNKQELLEAIARETELIPQVQRLTPPNGHYEGWRWLVVDTVNALADNQGGLTRIFVDAFVIYADRWLQGQKMNV